jgi:hypothetical protein
LNWIPALGKSGMLRMALSMSAGVGCDWLMVVGVGGDDVKG